MLGGEDSGGRVGVNSGEEWNEVSREELMVGRRVYRWAGWSGLWRGGDRVGREEWMVWGGAG